MATGQENLDGVQQLHTALTLSLAPADREFALGMLEPNIDKARAHFEGALAVDRFHQAARRQLYLIALIMGDAATMAQIADAARALFPDLPDGNEFALGYFAFTDHPDQAEQAAHQLAAGMDSEQAGLTSLFAKSIPTVRDELEIASGSLDAKGHNGMSAAGKIISIMSQLNKQRASTLSGPESGFGGLWFNRCIASPAWVGRLEQMLHVWEGMFRFDPGWLPAKARAALNNPAVLGEIEASLNETCRSESA